MRWISFAAAVASVASSSPSHARESPEPLVLEPTSDWVLDYADERCSLLRDFGAGEDAVKLRIDSFGSMLNFRMTVSGQPVPDPNGPTGNLSLKFSPDSENRDVGSMRGRIASNPAAITTISYVPAEWGNEDDDSELDGQPEGIKLANPELKAFELAATSVTFDFGSGKVLELHTREMARPLKALRDCVDNLRESWGLDPAVERALSRRAAPQEHLVLDLQRKYPGRMIFRRMNGYVPVRIMVDAEGNSSDCTVQIAQVEKEFSTAVCEGLSGKFNPALDSGGSPVNSVYYVTVVFVLG